VADHSMLCEECQNANPAGSVRCLFCGHRLGDWPSDPPHVRPYSPPRTPAPFVAQRKPDEIAAAREYILTRQLFAWRPPHRPPCHLTDGMIADAENVLRLKLPAALLAILQMQNGGTPRRRRFHPDYLELNELRGIAPGCTTDFALQQMPGWIWNIFEGFLGDEIYRQWRDAFAGTVHPDWAAASSIPQTILLLGDDLHWGVGLNYVRCGRQGNPSVVHVEMECARSGAEILTELAPDFMSFLGMLEE
jgi:hypothetical protein